MNKELTVTTTVEVELETVMTGRKMARDKMNMAEVKSITVER